MAASITSEVLAAEKPSQRCNSREEPSLVHAGSHYLHTIKVIRIDTVVGHNSNERLLEASERHLLDPLSTKHTKECEQHKF